MTLRTFTTQEKLDEVDRMIRIAEMHAADRGTEAHRQVSILKAVASDLRGRLAAAPSAALVDLERRVGTVARTKTRAGYSASALHQLGEGFVVRWPVVKQALERFGSEIENGEMTL